MITIEGPEGTERNDLATVASGGIAKPAQAGLPLTVGLLEKALLERYPRSDAESWDCMGLLVGDPSKPVKGVCVALDVTKAAIRTAAACGANVLLTHHPAFLSAPPVISPSREIATSPGVNVWEAVQSGVALMNFHTALDVSDDARNLFMGLLKLDYQRMAVPADAGEGKGYGYLCSVRAQDAPLSLAQLAARCTSVFGRTPRVWGDRRSMVASVVFANGSAGNVVEACLANKTDCLICGELGYHLALDASQAGLCIIELGHDASELPLTAVLAEAAVESGVSADAVRVIDQARNWSCYDSTRL
jgi:putative NIF3 family GTP cyclohydrolase 1 type 2